MSRARLAADPRDHRWLMVLLGMVMLAVLPIVGYLMWAGYQAAIGAAETTTRNYAAILEARLEVTLRRADANLQSLTRTIPAAALSKQAVPRYARELNADLDYRLLNFKEIVGFRVTDRHGDMLYSSASASTPYVSASDRSYFRQLRDKPQAGLVFSEVITGRISHRPVVVMARVLTDGGGNFSGIVFAPLELEHFLTLFQSLAIGPQGPVALRRSDDQSLVLRWPYLADEVNKPRNPQNPIAKRIAAGDRAATLQFAAQIDGVERIYSYRALERYPFYVNVGLGRDHVLAEWRTRSLTIGAVTLLLLALLGGLLLRLWRTQVRETQAATALSASERFARASLDALSSHIAVLDADGRILATNRRWREFAEHNGQPPERVSEGADYLATCQQAATMGDEAAAAAAALIRDLVSGRRTEDSFEYACHSPQEQRWFVCHGTRFPGEGPVRVVMSHENVTARKLAEAALHASENRFREMFEQAAVGIALVDPDGRFLQFNRRLCDIVGYSAEELAQRTFKDISHPDELAENLALRERLLRKEIPFYALEKRYVRKNGESVWVSLTSSLIAPSAEQSGQTVAIIEDIHLRKLAELGLQALASEHRGEAFLRHVTLTLAQLSEVEFAFIGETDPSNRNVTTRTLSADGEMVPNFSYDLDGTPCEGVVDKELCVFPAGVQQQFPRDELLATMGLESYAATPLWSAARTPLGLLGIMSRRPLGNADAVRMLLNLLAIRVSAELEREHAVAQITRVRDQLSLALDASNIALWSWDAASDAIYLDAGWARMLGETPRERYATGAELATRVHPDDLAATVQAQYDCLRGTAGEYRVEHRIRVADDSWKWIESRGKVVARDAQGRALRMAGTNLDITERKKAEEALRRLNQDLEFKVLMRTAALEQANAALAVREEETRSVVDYMVDCVITIDQDGIIQSANPMVEKIFGHTVDEVLGQNVSMLMPEPHRGAHDGYIERYRRSGEAHVIGIGRVVEGLHKNGERIALELAISEYTAHGQLFFTGILRDIRERVRIMKDLDQARLDAEQASQAKSAFLAAMSHEIRTPMNGVIGMVDVLHQTSLKGYQVEIVDTIRDSAYSLLGIIEDILDFSKIEAGRLEIECVSTPVAAVVEQVCDMMDHLAGSKQVELTLYTDPAIPGEVLGDALRLRQVLINLVNNAIKFSAGGQRPGKVSLRAQLVERNAERVVLEFRATDNGIGMDQATQARLFTSFSQADVSTTRRFGGTGLGLAIAGRLVKLMGGEIAVQSVLGQGSTFSVRLPFLPLPAESVAGEVAADVAGLSCLVVGGAQGLADDLAVYLTHAGASVERAPDLTTARERACAHGAGLSLWVIDAGGCPPTADELRAAATALSDLEVRFVVIGRGHRRKPRAAAADLIEVDGNALDRQTFLRAVAIAAGRAEAEAPLFSARIKAPVGFPSHELARQEGRLILVAEDNETNQKVILRQLGLLGFAADVAGNGKEALERWRSGGYALLLTDLHMPQMDGYELTLAIRRNETGERRAPIIALTANALKGEAKRCRIVGMDDYLSKPVPLEKLKAMLGKWLPLANESAADLSAPLAPQAAASGAVDLRVLKALVGDDAALIRELLHDFRASLTKIAAELRAACQADAATEAGALAHKLKSAAHSVGALKLGALCAEIERAGKAGDNATLVALMRGFEQELAVVETCLDSILRERDETATR